MKQALAYKNGLCLSYAEYGDKNGFPLLIQHGLIASIEDGDLFTRLLELKTRLICIARPGYGESSPIEMGSFAEWGDIVAPLVQELDLPRFDILGMSSGAPYSYALGYRFPDQARHIYILSGIPALYDEIAQSHWPFPPIKDQSMPRLQELAHEWFFANLTPAALQSNDVRDSMAHNGFGVAQDLKLRFIDWGFRLPEVRQKVFMRHSKTDDSVPYQAAVRTAELLPNCDLELTETGPHFSKEVLDDFILNTIIDHLRP